MACGFEFDSGWQRLVEHPFEVIDRGKKFCLLTKCDQLFQWGLRYTVSDAADCFCECLNTTLIPWEYNFIWITFYAYRLNVMVFFSIDRDWYFGHSEASISPEAENRIQGSFSKVNSRNKNTSLFNIWRIRLFKFIAQTFKCTYYFCQVTFFDKPLCM